MKFFKKVRIFNTASALDISLFYSLLLAFDLIALAQELCAAKLSKIYFFGQQLRN